MLQKWWGAGVLAALALAWFVLEERTHVQPTRAAGTEQSRSLPTARAAESPPAPPAMRRDVHVPPGPKPVVGPVGSSSGPPPALTGAGTAGLPPRGGGADPSGSGPGRVERMAGHPDAALAPSRPAAFFQDAPGKSSEPAGATRPADGATSAGDPVARAKAMQAAGDRKGAEGLLRSEIRDSRDIRQAARAALFLAGLVDSPVEGRQFLSIAMQQGVVHGDEFEEAGALLREWNRQPRESLLPLLETETWTVKSGDSLWKLCNKDLPRQYGLSPETGLVKLVNGLSRDDLKVGQKLQVPKAPLELRVNADEHGLSAWLGDTLLAAYRVGLGRDDRTPRRRFRVEVKQKDPSWYFEGKAVPFGDPENLLGTRWMGFENSEDARGFGIHGTWAPESIGKNESSGCVRMRNAEVEELFELVARGTPVTIS